MRLSIVALIITIITPLHAAADEATVAEPCVFQSAQLSCAAVQSAGQLALDAITDRQAAGATVDTARQLVAEGDRICLLQLLWEDATARSLRLVDHWCMTQSGAYELRREGLSERLLNQVRGHIRAIMDDPDSWQSFHDVLLQTPDRFAAVQHLIRSSPTYRTRILKLVLRRDTVFFGQNHADGMISN